MKFISNLDKYANNSLGCPSPPPSGNEDKESPHFHYIFHFIKKGEKIPKNQEWSYMQPRHVNLRGDVRKKAMAICQFRMKYGNLKERLVGVDAASAEIGCRPEVFAQAFRYLKKYSWEDEYQYLENTKMGNLGFTYHVGEDFLDLADGLRAVDEAILFLNLQSGDRIGHGLALGVEPKMYYQRKRNSIILSKQDLLDNMAWLLVQIEDNGIGCPEELRSRLRWKYEELYAEIFRSDKGFSHQPYRYYQSWLLRGDDPQLYSIQQQDKQPDRYDVKDSTDYQCWDRYGLNDDSKVRQARSNNKAKELYWRYHFDEAVRKNGGKPVEYDIPNGYPELIKEIQNAMMRKVSDLQLVIETNPTSNKYIGAFEQYAEDPISRFFNLGLTYNQEEINACPQLSVSINTDDAGVFSTSVPNEFALIAAAMDEMRNEDGTKKYTTRMIYDWLERIRAMGFEQRFRKDRLRRNPV